MNSSAERKAEALAILREDVYKRQQNLMDLFSGTDFPDQLLKAENVEECYRLACAEIGNLE